jgi:ABC-type glycerol-3-phosphate transport system permease component
MKTLTYFEIIYLIFCIGVVSFVSGETAWHIGEVNPAYTNEWGMVWSGIFIFLVPIVITWDLARKHYTRLPMTDQGENA